MLDVQEPQEGSDSDTDQSGGDNANHSGRRPNRESHNSFTSREFPWGIP